MHTLTSELFAHCRNADFVVCASQWLLNDDIDVPLDQTSFSRAMLISQGTLSVVDRNGKCFSRIWCVYELFRSLVRKQHRLFDMYTAHAHAFDGFKPKKGLMGTYQHKFATDPRQAVGITTGPVYVDVNSKWACQRVDNAVQSAIDAKAQRESFFPIDILEKAIEFKCENGEASHAEDREKILSAINEKNDAEYLGNLVHGVVAVTALNRILAAKEVAKVEDLECVQQSVQKFVRAVERCEVMTIDLPTEVDTETNLTMLVDGPDVKYKLLVLSTKCESIPEPLWQMGATLTSLDIRAPIEELSSGITQLQSLKHLTLRECKRLKLLPEDLGKLKKLNLLNIRLCSNLTYLPNAVGETCPSVSARKVLMVLVLAGEMSSHMYTNIFGCELGLRPNLFAEQDKLQSPESKQNLNSGKASLKIMAVDQVMEWFEHTDWDVRKVAADTLSQLSPEKWELAAPMLLVCLDHGDWYIRAAAIEVLKKLLQNQTALDMNNEMSVDLALSILQIHKLMPPDSKYGVNFLSEISLEQLERDMPRLLDAAAEAVNVQKVNLAMLGLANAQQEEKRCRKLSGDGAPVALKRAQHAATSAKAKLQWLTDGIGQKLVGDGFAKMNELMAHECLAPHLIQDQNSEKTGLQMLIEDSEFDVSVVEASLNELNKLPPDRWSGMGVQLLGLRPYNWKLLVRRKLLTRLNDKDWRVRRAAVKVFGKWSNKILKKMAPYAIGRLEDVQWSVRASAVEVFGKLETPMNVAPQLRLRLEDDNSDVRAAAVKVVEKLAPRPDCLDKPKSKSPLKQRMKAAAANSARARWKTLKAGAKFGAKCVKAGVDAYVKDGQKEEFQGEKEKMLMYNRENLLKRRAIKDSPVIHRAIREMWEVLFTIFSGQLVLIVVWRQMCDNTHGNFFDFNGEMTRYGYLEVYTRIAKVPDCTVVSLVEILLQVMLPRDEFNEVCSTFSLHYESIAFYHSYDKSTG